ncbi:MAG: hypothetical protein ACKVSF_10990 [Alphaproteobacteria bacterium]
MEEWHAPTTGLGRFLHGCFRIAVVAAMRVAAWPFRAILGGPAHVTVFYDLAVSPVTYDVAWALAAGEMARRDANLASVRLVIVPGPHRGLRREDDDYEAVVDHAARIWRLDNIVLPMARLLPSVDGVLHGGSRGRAVLELALARGPVYPLGYGPFLPVAPKPLDVLGPACAGRPVPLPLRASEQALRHVDIWLAARAAGRKAVVITLRQYGYGAARNSNLDAWLAFARRMDTTIYAPIFVPDTQTALAPALAPGVAHVFPEAAWNIGLRMALYERAHLNLMVNTGPHLLCMFNEHCRYVMFKILTPSVRQTSDEYMRFLGFQIGGQPPFATAFQKWVWEGDALEVIEREFGAMCQVIERREAVP